MTTTSILFIAFVGMAAANAVGQPAITRQPADQSVSLGANVTFQTTATGAAPLNYQWHFNETEMRGATNRTLILTNVQLPDAGVYTVVVTNVTGPVSSRAATIEVDAAFTKITTGGIVTSLATSWGAAWGDFDNDGFIDLVVSNSGADFLYQNNRDGTFIPITSSPLVAKESDNGSGVAWADYDNDGNLDLVAGKDPGKNNLFRNNGDGTFTKTVGNAVVADGQSNSTTWGDYNNDGYVICWLPAPSARPIASIGTTATAPSPR